MNSDISLILKNFKTRDNFLGYNAAVAFENELVYAIESMLERVNSSSSDLSFADFKRIFKFLAHNTIDDSATGLTYLYEALNKMLQVTLRGVEGKNWKWVMEHLFCGRDYFLETVILIYTKDKYQAEIMAILQKLVLEESVMEFNRNSGEYYIAIYKRAIGSADYEAYLDEHIQNIDVKILKKDLLLSRGEKEAAFNLIKSETEYVLEAAELLDGEAKEQYLFSQILDGRETLVGQRRSWWDKLCEEVKDGKNGKLNYYMNILMSSPKHCEMVNWQLYELGRFEELKNRIDTGWIYDDIWGRLNTDIVSKYNAIEGYKMLKSVYPEWCAQIMIDYAVFMIDKNMNRQSYKMSAKTMAAAGKLNNKSMDIARKAAQELAENHPKRTAMIEELKIAGFLH